VLTLPVRPSETGRAAFCSLDRMDKFCFLHLAWANPKTLGLFSHLANRHTSLNYCCRCHLIYPFCSCPAASQNSPSGKTQPKDFC